jgi:outer membrane protein OmpA-like peptidoglycan-associated protein
MYLSIVNKILIRTSYMNKFSKNFASEPETSDSLESDLDIVDSLLDLFLDDDQSESDLSDSRRGSELEIPDFDSNSLSSQYLDIEVDVETQSQDLTLEKAVEYQRFLRQTVEQQQESSSQIDELKISPVTTNEPHVETQLVSSSDLDLVDSVNALIPLIIELLKCQINDSQETIIQAVTPVLDQLIEQRSLEEAQKMAVAIAKILPAAITEEINLAPEAIARAIAPEIAIAIREQIRLDDNAISQTLGPEMGKAIKAQIELERDAMVDALYPVIGNTIAKYMVEVVQAINSKVENTLSPEGIKRKIRAKIRGVSEAELIFQESVGCQVQAVFLIDKDSGVVIQEVQKQEQHLNSDMIAGMLTAIRSFANDCIASGSELDTIDYGDWQIPIEVAGYCYLAVVLKGEPTKGFRTKIRQILGDIIMKHGEVIKQYEGNMATIPLEVKSMLEQLVELETEQPAKSSSPSTLLWLLAFILGLILIPWGIVNHRAQVAHQVEKITAIELDAAPELSVYRLEPQVRKGILTVQGRVPSEYLRQQATAVTQPIASQNNLQLDNQIITVDVPTDPSVIMGEIERLTRLFNQQPDTLINTKYQPNTLTITGFILNQSQQPTIIQAFRKIPGVEQVIVQVSDRLPTIEQQIEFDSGSNKLKLGDNARKLEMIAEFLAQYPQLHLKLIAFNDPQGSIAINQKLAQERCDNVKAALVAKGVNPDRLVAHCQQNILFSDKNKSETWFDRYVSFEPFIPMN